MVGNKRKKNVIFIIIIIIKGGVGVELLAKKKIQVYDYYLKSGKEKGIDIIIIIIMGVVMELQLNDSWLIIIIFNGKLMNKIIIIIV